jgi:hypothetical protein
MHEYDYLGEWVALSRKHLNNSCEVRYSRDQGFDARISDRVSSWRSDYIDFTLFRQLKDPSCCSDPQSDSSSTEYCETSFRTLFTISSHSHTVLWTRELFAPLDDDCLNQCTGDILVWILTNHQHQKQHQTTLSLLLVSGTFIPKYKNNICWLYFCFNFYTSWIFCMRSGDASNWDFSCVKNFRILVILIIWLLTIVSIRVLLERILSGWEMR